ncbi:MAG: acyl-CoA dehydrogenase family protein, partial [Proteobacteria bacterium]|nr:acyl-CoA dehydrogenase family protein [Pseudomonadota bacterium]
MINLLFHDTPSELISVADSARKFASSNFSTHEKEFDINDFKKMAAQGFAGASIAENYGGSNLSNFAIANLIFELAKVQLGPAIYLSVHLMSAKLINNFSTNKNDLLSALANGEKFAAFCLTEANSGSDAAALQTKAEKRNDKFILNGEKIYITSAGHADVYLVFARTSADKTKGISAFIVEKNSPGLSFGKEEKKMGCLGSPIASVKFDNCEIPEANLLGSPGDGFKIALSGLDGGRVNIAAAACGLSASALEICSEYAKNRKQFSQSIADFQGIQFLISDMLMHLKSSLLLVREAATELD